MLKTIWSAACDLIFPPCCPSCKARVSAHGAWCDVCLSAIWQVREVGIPAGSALDRCYALCRYTGGLKKIIRAIKFHGGHRYAAHGLYLLERMPQDWLEKIDLTVPVPLAEARLKTRGYNQTELLFRQWTERNNLNWCDALRRTRETTPQWELTLTERRKNIKGAFELAHPVTGHILLVDDIYTTGTTLSECARVLKKAGASKVTGLVLASEAE